MNQTRQHAGGLLRKKHPDHENPKTKKPCAMRVEGFANVESVDGEPSIDSFDTVFEAEGWDLSRFDRRGSLPMLFDHSDPVGVWDRVEVRTTEGVHGLWVEGRLFGDTARQQEVQMWVEQGILTDLSVRFQFLESEQHRTEGGRPFMLIRAALTETSLVKIGSSEPSTFEASRAFAGLGPGQDIIAILADPQARAATILRLESFLAALRATEAISAPPIALSTLSDEDIAEQVERELATLGFGTPRA